MSQVTRRTSHTVMDALSINRFISICKLSFVNEIKVFGRFVLKDRWNDKLLPEIPWFLILHPVIFGEIGQNSDNTYQEIYQRIGSKNW